MIFNQKFYKFNGPPCFIKVGHNLGPKLPTCPCRPSVAFFLNKNKTIFLFNYNNTPKSGTKLQLIIIPREHTNFDEARDEVPAEVERHEALQATDTCPSDEDCGGGGRGGGGGG